MKIVVTGACGRLGAELCRQSGPEAIGLDLPQFDLTDRLAVLSTLAELRPQVVINTAAYTRVDDAQTEIELCRAVNADGVAHLVEACRTLDATLLQISTDYVFGRDARRRTPYREVDPPGPLGIYAHSKLEGERHAARLPRHCIVRTCGLFGPPGPRSGESFVEAMLRLARRKRYLHVIDDQQISPSYVAHVARAVRFLAQRGARGIFHVVNSGETTWHGFASEIFRLWGTEIELEPISAAQYGAGAPRPAYSVLDTGKFHALPGCPAMPPWQQALEEYSRSQTGG